MLKQVKKRLGWSRGLRGMRVADGLRSGRCRALISCILAGLSAVDALCGDDGGSSIAYSGSDMQRAVAAYREGRLANAWKSLVESFENMPASDAFKDFARCENDPGCPQLSLLGTVAGEPFPVAASSLCGELRNIIRRWRCRYLMRVHRKAHDAQPHAFPPHRMALARYRETYILNRDTPQERRISSRPFVLAELDGASQLALVDTGATRTYLRPEIGRKSKFIAKGTVTDFNGAKHRSRLVEVGEFAFGDVRLSKLKMISYGELPLEIPVIVGMEMLLRYEAVCFDWRSRAVHLGELGPCAAGKTVPATLKRMMEIELPLLTLAGKRIAGKVDTGAILTYCPQEDAASDASEGTFAIGDLPQMRFDCVYGDSGVTEDGTKGLIGMQTLGEFQAFGWKLNPLAVYFVADGA